MVSYVVAGASRGIGLGFVRKLSSDPQNVVFALVRNPEGSKELQEYVQSSENKHKNVHILKMDLDDKKTISAAAESVSKLTGGSLDVLILNGALMKHPRAWFSFIDYPDPETIENDMLDFFKTNVVGNTHSINAFRPLLLKDRQAKETPARVLVVTSGMGSAAYALAAKSDNCCPYAISKAALNMVVTKFAVSSKIKKENIVFLAMSPGLVKTMEGSPEQVEKMYTGIVSTIKESMPAFRGAISVEQSVDEQLAILSRMTVEQSGALLHSTGEHIDATNGNF